MRLVRLGQPLSFPPFYRFLSFAQFRPCFVDLLLLGGCLCTNWYDVYVHNFYTGTLNCTGKFYDALGN